MQAIITTQQIAEVLGEPPASFRLFKSVSGVQLPIIKIPSPAGRKKVAHPVDAVVDWLRRSKDNFTTNKELELYKAAEENSK